MDHLIEEKDQSSLETNIFLKLHFIIAITAFIFFFFLQKKGVFWSINAYYNSAQLCMSGIWQKMLIWNKNINNFQRGAATFWLLFQEAHTHSWKLEVVRNASWKTGNILASEATPLCQYFLFGWLPLSWVGFRKIHWYEIIFPNINIAVEKIHFRKGKIFHVLLRFRQINTMPMIATEAIKSNFYHIEQKRCLLTLSVLSTIFRLTPHLIIDYLSYLWVFFLLISLSKYNSGQVSLLCFSYRSL